LYIYFSEVGDLIMFIVDKGEIKAGFELAKEEGIKILLLL
jgi:hypothetical protein